MVNLERICEDIARITSDNVDLSIGGKDLIAWSRGVQWSKDLQRHCKDYISDNVDPGGTMLILGGGSIDSQLGKDL